MLVLKPITLQRKHETRLNVKVAKAEKSNWMAYAEIKAPHALWCAKCFKMGNQQPSPE